jgi:hypothetical protein
LFEAKRKAIISVEEMVALLDSQAK